MNAKGTHDVRIDRESGLVVKRFVSSGRSEPARDWRALERQEDRLLGLLG